MQNDGIIYTCLDPPAQPHGGVGPSLLVAVAPLASYWPARRAWRVEPSIVLRGE